MPLHTNPMRSLAALVHALSPNCREAVRLQSLSLDAPLPRLRLVGLRIHLLLCRWCRRYRRQVQFLRLAARRYEMGSDLALTPKLSAEARERINRALRKADS